MTARPLLAVLGPTGYTGRLVVAEARRAGLPLRLVGRRREALEALAAAGDELAVADARDDTALRDAFAGVFAVVSCAGPFLDLGPAPVAAAIAAGAHYLDSSGEQAWTRLLQERLDADAAARGVAVLPCFGFDYVPGDLAARLAAEGLEPLDELVVAYAVTDASGSRGTRRTVARILGQPLVAYVDGRLVPTRLGAAPRMVSFPFGEKSVAQWSGTEPLTVPRHTQVRTVRSYVRAPAAARRAGPLLRLAAPLVRLSARFGPDGPPEAERARARFAVVAEARGPAGGRRVTLTGSDMYLLTARLLVAGAELLLAGEGRASGVVAPAEAFAARALLARAGPLCRLESAESLG